MKVNRRFPKDVVAAIRDGKILGIRAGMKPHRIIGIWSVVVENRVFVRSWSLKERSWYRAFLEEPVGAIEVDGREIPVRAVFTRSERLKTAVDSGLPREIQYPGVTPLCARLRAQDPTRHDDGTSAGTDSTPWSAPARRRFGLTVSRLDLCYLSAPATSRRQAAAG